MTPASESERAKLTASVTNLAAHVARLAQNVDCLVAMAKEHRQPAAPYADYAVSDEHPTGLVEETTICPPSPIAEPPQVQSKAKNNRNKMKNDAESLIAVGVSDLYERLGGFLKDSLQSTKSS